eukprot:gb/GEZN01001616.1/.p1 GENE.gb/GEZN01001616.1/~~gb/GEZN01001616.1/.p1  ORF type:complete len:888 (-),score=96.59 gb/GEZN01001616.1/:195-2858(-)
MLSARFPQYSRLNSNSAADALQTRSPGGGELSEAVQHSATLEVVSPVPGLASPRKKGPVTAPRKTPKRRLRFHKRQCLFDRAAEARFGLRQDEHRQKQEQRCQEAEQLDKENFVRLQRVVGLVWKKEKLHVCFCGLLMLASALLSVEALVLLAHLLRVLQSGESVLGCKVPGLEMVDSSQGSYDRHGNIACPEQLESVIELSVSFVLLSAAWMIVNSWRRFFSLTIGERLVNSLQARLHASLLRQDVSFFDVHPADSLLVRLSVDCSRLRRLLTKTGPDFLEAFVVSSVMVCYLVYLQWTLSLLVLIVLPCVFAASRQRGRRLRALGRLADQRSEQATILSAEAIRSLRIVRAFGQEEIATKRYQLEMHQAYMLQKEWAMLSGRFRVCSWMVVSCIVVSEAFLAFALVRSGQVSPATLVSYILASLALAVQLAALNAQDSAAVFPPLTQQIVDLLFITPGEVSVQLDVNGNIPNFVVSPLVNRSTIAAPLHSATLSPSPAVAPAIPSTPLLEVQNVQFTYPARSLQDLDYSSVESPVLNRLNFALQPGQTVVLMGAKGTGKSTLVNLLFGFYPPSKGSILWQGNDMAGMQCARLSKNMALVSQEPVLLSGSVFDNIAMGTRTTDDSLPSEKAVVAAARAAGALQFIEALPEGFDTLVSNRSHNLNQAQKQCLALARALLRQPTLLVLDDLTSNLDEKGAAMVQRSIHALLQADRSVSRPDWAGSLTSPAPFQQTINCEKEDNSDVSAAKPAVLIVTDSLATAKLADQILVLQGGCIVQSGSHERLLADITGPYFHMMDAQLRSSSSPVSKAPCCRSRVPCPSLPLSGNLTQRSLCDSSFLPQSDSLPLVCLTSSGDTRTLDILRLSQETSTPARSRFDGAKRLSESL